MSNSREKELALEKAYIKVVRGKIYICIDNAVICSKNFSGVEKRNPYDPKEVVNSEGNRNFSIMLNQEAADLISNFRLDDHPDKAFTVSVKVPPEGSEDPTPKIFMSIKVSYKYNIDQKGNKRPWSTNPIISQYSSKGRTEKDESNVDGIDDVYIERADLIFTPGPYSIKATGKKGLTAYLSQLNYKILENELNAKWDQDYSTDGPEEFEQFEEVPFA